MIRLLLLLVIVVSIISNNDVLLIFLQIFKNFWTDIANCQKEFLWPSPPFDDVLMPQFWSIYFTRHLSVQDLFWLWPAHFRLHWASILYMPENLDFSGMNLFGIYCHHLTFSIYWKWLIIETRRLWAFALYTIQISAPFRNVEISMVRYTEHLVLCSGLCWARLAFSAHQRLWKHLTSGI